VAKVNHKRSLAKAFTWRITGTIDTFVLSILITKQIKFALAISGTELVTKILLYYFHERVWEKVSWGEQEVTTD
jgi:uncharacterized membrane protein